MSDGISEGYKMQRDAEANHEFLQALLVYMTCGLHDKDARERYEAAAKAAKVADPKVLIDRLWDRDSEAWLSIIFAAGECYNGNLQMALKGISPFRDYHILPVSSSSDNKIYFREQDFKPLVHALVEEYRTEEEKSSEDDQRYVFLLPHLDPRTVRVIRRKKRKG